MTQSFRVNCPDIESGQTLFVGLAAPGMAGLAAVSDIVDTVESTEIGHISPAELPATRPTRMEARATTYDCTASPTRISSSC